MLDDEGDAGQLAPPPGGTGIMVGHIWRQAPTRGAPGGGHKLQRFGPRASDGPDASAGIQMITADDFLVACRTRKIDFFTGVPCSFLTPLINRTIGEPSLDYVGAASEGEAIAIAAGAWLAGRNTVVMCQNSGLGNGSTRSLRSISRFAFQPC